MNAVVEPAERNVVLAATTPEAEAGSLLSVIERVVRDPNIDINKVERLLEMQERIVSRRAEADFNAAMAACQAEMKPVAVDATNPQTSSKYASFAALDRALRPIYTAHGFALSFDEGETPKADHIRMVCHVSHRAGFTRTYHRDMPVDTAGIKGTVNMTRTHANASAQSYAMRYLERLIFNVAVGEGDDDGNGGGGSVALLDPAQVKDLTGRIGRIPPVGQAYAKKLASFLKWAKVSRLEEIPVTAIPACIAAINARAAQASRQP